MSDKLRTSPAGSDESYAAALDDFGFYLSEDATRAFKVYRLSITGRSSPGRYEWSRSVLTPETFLTKLREILPAVASRRVNPHARIREATVADTDAIVRLGIEAHMYHANSLPDIFQPSGPEIFTASDVHALHANPQCLTLLAECEDVSVGYLQGEIQDLPATSVKLASRILYIRQMGVTSAYRGCGVGRALLDAVRDRLPCYGVDRVALDVYVFNNDARRLYKSAGFIPVREYQLWEISSQESAICVDQVEYV